MLKRSLFFYPIFTISILLLLLSCAQNPQRNVTRGIYFWRTVFTLSKEEISWLNENEIKKLYVKFFDVDWNPQLSVALPVGDVTVSTKSLKGIEIIPVIFITNRTLKNIHDSLIQELSDNIYKKVISKASVFDSMKINEFQLDCDWTITTKEKYFKLIELLTEKCNPKNIEVTSTIRLHQVKFFNKTGVPPVSRGMLMFYNMSDVSDIRVKNSIFDEEIAQKYLVNFDKYPLKLDVVLPAFSWVCLFRNGKLIALINDVKRGDLEKNSSFEKYSENLFRAVEDCWLNGTRISVDDYLRAEQIEPGTTLASAEMIAQYIKNNDIMVSIYHLNSEVIKNYDKEVIADIVSCFD